MKRSILGRFVAGRFVAALGDQFLLFAVPLLIYKTTGSITQSGLAFLIEWLPRVVTSPIGGVFADRFGGVRVYLASDFARLAACLLAFVVLALYPPSLFVALSLLTAVMSVFSLLAYVALETNLPRFVSSAEIPKAQSLLQGSEQTSQVLGPAIAGFCAGVLGTRSLLLMTAGAFALSFFNIYSMRRALRDAERAGAPAQGQSRHVGAILAGLRQGVLVLRGTPVLFALIALTMTVNLMIGVTLASTAAIVTGVFGKPDRFYGLLFTVTGVVGVASFFAVPWLTKRISVVRLGLASYAVMATGALLLGMAPTYPVFAAGLALLMGSVGIFNVFIRTERIRVIPGEHLGKTIGLIVLLNQVPLPLAGAIVARFGGVYGAQGVIRTVTCACLALALPLFPYLLSQRRAAESARPAPNAA